ncbi:c-type cytochrome [Rhizobium sullae]|uniref:c-type cytochrome n=1 Tax=Rhizobium sullae TaxID=50338 RepID=UPI001FCCC67B|nr:c-type cytochrome [Rhizobium sullae]
MSMNMLRPSIVLLFTLVLCPAVAQAEGDVARGEKLFARCSACHSTDGTRKIGPTLAGVVGRTAATVGNARFSKALIESEIIWTEETLEEYLSEPKKLVPGTTMVTRIPDLQDRKDVISYLKTLN